MTLLSYTTNTIADDDPTPCVARSSAAVTMTVCNVDILVILWRDFQSS